MVLLADAGPHQSLLPKLGESGVCATAAAKWGEPKKSKKKEKKFDVGDEMMVEHGPVFNKTSKRAAFESYSYGPCRVTNADHLRYELVSSTGQVTRQGIHSVRLVR